VFRHQKYDNVENKNILLTINPINMKKFHELKLLILLAERHAIDFYQKGNKTAGTRLRKALFASKTLAHDIRKDVSAKKKS